MKPFLAGILLVLTASCSTSEPGPVEEQLPEVLTEQQLQAMPTERIRALGIQRFGWSPPETLELWPRDKLIKLFLKSQKCSGDNSPTQPPEDPAPYTWSNSPEELDILEAGFRYQFEHNGSSATTVGRVDYLFVALGERNASKDPSAELLARFADHSPRVLPVSSAASGSWRGVEHKVQGGEGIILHIERLRRIDTDTVDVDGGYYEASLSASGNTYRVKRRDGSWEVVCDAMWWMS